jgi:dipeptidase
MCDTLVAVNEATADGTVILAKNSDRHPNEAHVLAHLPPARYDPDSTVRCTHIEIPQGPETREVLLAKPFWTWGCEMGINGCGVAIANEAVFTKEPYEKEAGLLGMDLVRLALERADTARQALDIVVELLGTYGQGGNHGYPKKETYHNAFIIADPREAWVLETAGRFWAAVKVRGVRTISNGLTIGREWDLAAPWLVEHALEKGWCKSRDDFHFARCYSDFLYTTFDGCKTRQSRSTELLEAQKNSVTVETMMSALRDHGAAVEIDAGAAVENGGGAGWNPSKGMFMETLCVHASFGPTRPGQSVGAMVAHLTPDLPTCWLTGTSGTCTSIFKPVYLGGAGLPDLGPDPKGVYDPASLWWAHERLHRAVIRDYATRMPLYRAERDALEAMFLRDAARMYEQYRRASAQERAAPLAALTSSCFERASQATSGWTEKVLSVPVRHRPSRLFSLAWNQCDKQAGFEQG